MMGRFWAATSFKSSPGLDVNSICQTNFAVVLSDEKLNISTGSSSLENSLWTVKFQAGSVERMTP